ncbi:hypothetical protein TR51_03315 [Kitasatospora griseola]|uniref:Uncharacterized protein n=1 Tax=Kitasatospora griseola TaxID=2064 RepID=A0A0D0PVT0_KITGR|nr:hypothetical protein TR51_03315 [Kitasatospora griseola]
MRPGSAAGGLPGDPDGVQPGAGVEFDPGGGQVVADGAGPQVQALGDLARLAAVRRQGEGLRLAFGERAGGGCESAGGEFGVDRGAARRDRPDRLGEPLRRGVLRHEPRRAGGRRGPQHLGPPMRRQDQHPATGQPFTQHARVGEAVGAGQVDVRHGHVGPVGERGGDHLVAVPGVGHHLDVAGRGEQRPQCAAHQVHVLGRRHSHRGGPTSPVDTERPGHPRRPERPWSREPLPTGATSAAHRRSGPAAAGAAPVARPPGRNDELEG